MTTPRLLFISGIGRSGTTALAHLLVSHPQVVLGVERYKYAYRHEDDRRVTADFFDRERFFDFSDGLTNVTPSYHPQWTTYYDRMAAKWDDARYVGDKVTHTRLLRMWDAMPGARIVYIVRDIEAVAASWQSRADNPVDSNWPAWLGVQRAVTEWNTGLRRARLASRRHPDQIALVEYSRLFADPHGASMEALLGWLGLEVTPEVVTSFETLHRKYADTVAPKDRSLSAADAAIVDENADRALYTRLVRNLAL